jgi:hypothetical protein
MRRDLLGLALLVSGALGYKVQVSVDKALHITYLKFLNTDFGNKDPLFRYTMDL